MRKLIVRGKAANRVKMISVTAVKAAKGILMC